MNNGVCASRPERLLDLLNILLSDVRYGLGAYLGVYLLTHEAWDAGSIGIALSVAGLAGLIAAPLTGALVDAVVDKRGVIAVAALIVMAASLAIPVAPHFASVIAAGVVGAVAGTIFGPAVSAISLGMVGPLRFPVRAGRNEAMFHAGNAICNVVVLLAASGSGDAAVFWVMAATALASMAAVLAIPSNVIDPQLARGFGPAAVYGRKSALRSLTASRGLLAFAGCGALFHLGNGAMLGLLGQKLALLVPGRGIALTAACAITAQLIMVPTAMLAGRYAQSIGRKPLYGAAFVVLAVRGVLYTVSNEPVWLVAVQLLDGLGAGLTGALFPVIVADVTRGSGHFALAQGATATAHGIGATLSATIAGEMVVIAGYGPTFLCLAAIAAVGGVLFFWLMPETTPPRLPEGAEQALHSHTSIGVSATR